MNETSIWGPYCIFDTSSRHREHIDIIYRTDRHCSVTVRMKWLNVRSTTSCFRKKHPLILLAISWRIVVWF